MTTTVLKLTEGLSNSLWSQSLLWLPNQQTF